MERLFWKRGKEKGSRVNGEKVNGKHTAERKQIIFR